MASASFSQVVYDFHTTVTMCGRAPPWKISKYEEGIKPILIKIVLHDLNPHCSKINRGLGLAAQNTNILKKNMKNLKKLRTKASYYKIKKSYCWFKIREDMELGLSVTLEEKNVCLLTKLFFTFAQIRDFRGFIFKVSIKLEITFGLKEQLIFRRLIMKMWSKIKVLQIIIQNLWIKF
jgi:ribosomal protein L5